jgi:hypothetical protein
MIYSELSKLTHEKEFAFNPEDLTLTGVINGYGTVIFDDKKSSEFAVVVFCESPKNDFSFAFLPKNAINSLKLEKNCVIIRLSAYIMSQENLPLLLQVADSAANSLTGKSLPVDMSVLEKPAESGTPRASLPTKTIITVAVCTVILILILFFPMTVVQRAVSALAAGGIIYFLAFRKAV